MENLQIDRIEACVFNTLKDKEMATTSRKSLTFTFSVLKMNEPQKMLMEGDERRHLMSYIEVTK